MSDPTMPSREPEPHDPPDHRRPLGAISAPGAVAVIGASEKAGSVGRSILWNLIGSPFAGTVSRSTRSGRMCWASSMGFSAFVPIGSMIDVGWGDLIGYPVASIRGLREALLRLDPTGREMRPRESGE